VKVLCTLAVGQHREYLPYTRPALERYAERHGYELCVIEYRLASERPDSWSKVVLLHRLVQRADLVVWIDADAIVVDASRDIADDLNSNRVLHLVEHNVADGRVPNCGVMALRGGADAQALLEAMWACREFVHHKWWENAALLQLLGYRTEPPIEPAHDSPWRDKLALLDRAWNSVPFDESPHPRIVHLPGVSHDERLERLALLA
jgi:hypothetical protein